MCGIVGYIGKKNALPILIDGLRALEYRGYDSAGIAVLDSSRLKVVKCKGRIDDLQRNVDNEKIKTRTGIGHTRWATHGKPSTINAHPHMDCARELVVVHNGIIENYQSLRERLIAKGHIFLSETDTEVLVHLIEDYYEEDLEFAIKAALHEVQGAYALAALSERDPDRLFVARSGSPLVIGLGKNENYIASDIPALLEHTRDILVLEEQEVAVITRNSVDITTMGNTPVKREPIRINWDRMAAEKMGYEYFMLKEINEQPRAIEDTLRGLMDLDGIELSSSPAELPDVSNIERIVILACGTSYHAGLVGKTLIEDFARIPVEVDIASEFRYRNPLVNEKTLVIAISQSGETADTIAGLREAKLKGAKKLGIVNVIGSTIAREADSFIQTHAGPEIGVASTKCFTVQITALMMLAIWLGREKKQIQPASLKSLLKSVVEIPSLVRTTLGVFPAVNDIAQRYSRYNHFLYLGRGINFPIALEGALKLKEISYIHAEGYPAGEMKHGPIALISPQVPTFVIATGESTYDKVLTNIMEVKAREGNVIALVNDDDNRISSVCDEVIHVPYCSEFLSPVINSIPVQMFAYAMARARGCDIDKPRNLAKTVTVE